MEEEVAVVALEEDEEGVLLRAAAYAASAAEAEEEEPEGELSAEGRPEAMAGGGGPGGGPGGREGPRPLVAPAPAPAPAAGEALGVGAVEEGFLANNADSLFLICAPVEVSEPDGLDMGGAQDSARLAIAGRAPDSDARRRRHRQRQTLQGVPAGLGIVPRSGAWSSGGAGLRERERGTRVRHKDAQGNRREATVEPTRMRRA